MEAITTNAHARYISIERESRIRQAEKQGIPVTDIQGWPVRLPEWMAFPSMVAYVKAAYGSEREGRFGSERIFPKGLTQKRLKELIGAEATETSEGIFRGSFANQYTSRASTSGRLGFENRYKKYSRADVDRIVARELSK